MSAPAADKDDMVRCNTCSFIVRGKTARKRYREKRRNCHNGCSIELRYGWAVRAIGPLKAPKP